MPRAYHHGNLRAALIDTAVELARAEGPDGVVLREVARRAGVSHNAAYRHFSDREQLLSEVAAVAMAALAESMRERVAAIRARDAGERARRRLREVGTAYVEFAVSEPGLFGVAFAAALPAEVKGAGEEAGEGAEAEAAVADPYALLNDALDELVAAGQVTPERRVGSELACWAAVHGFAVLHTDGPLHDATAEERHASLEHMLDVVEAGLTL